MGDCGTPVMVTSYDIERRKTVFLKSWHPEHSELLCAEASRATSAAPTYFEPVNLQWAEQSRTLIDGAYSSTHPPFRPMLRPASCSPMNPLPCSLWAQVS